MRLGLGVTAAARIAPRALDQRDQHTDHTQTRVPAAGARGLSEPQPLSPAPPLPTPCSCARWRPSRWRSPSPPPRGPSCRSWTCRPPRRARSPWASGCARASRCAAGRGPYCTLAAARAAAAGLRAAAPPGPAIQHQQLPSPPAQPRLPLPPCAEAGHAALAPGLAARRLCLARCEQHHGGRGGGTQRACLPRCL